MLLWTFTSITGILSAMSTIMLVGHWLKPQNFQVEPSQFLPFISGGVYCATTGLIGILLIRSFVAAIRLGDDETIANIQAGLWKYASYWIIIVLAVILVMALSPTVACQAGTCVTVNIGSVGRAALVPALLAVSIGFLPALVDTRKELRNGRIRVAKRLADSQQSQQYAAPLHYGGTPRPSGQPRLRTTAVLLIGLAAVSLLRRPGR